MPFALSPRLKRVLKWIGYPVLALVSFLFMLQWTFPYDRVAGRMKEALAAKYDVTIGDTQRGFWPGSVTFTSVALTSRPTKAGEQPSTIFFKQLDVSVGLLGLLGGTANVHLDASIGKGSIAGTIGLSGSQTTAALTIEDISAEAVPGLAGVVGLPIGGKLNGEIDLTLPKGDLRQAEGKVDFLCKTNCTIGDGVAKIYPKGRPGSSAAIWGKEGLTVAKLFLKDFSVEMTLTKGKLDLSKFEVHSDDGEIYADFHAQIQKTLKESPVTGCIKFKASDVLKKREPKFGNGLDVTGAPLGPDNYYYVKLAGTLGDVKRQPFVCSLDGSEVPGAKVPSSVSRQAGPRITPTPDEPRPTIPPPTVASPPPGEAVPPPSAPPTVTPPPSAPPPTPETAGSGAPGPQPMQMVPPPAGEAAPPPPPAEGAPPPPTDGTAPPVIVN